MTSVFQSFLCRLRLLSLLRHLRQRQRPGRGDDALLVDLDAGQRHHVGAGGDQDMFRRERRRLAAVGGRDVDLAGPGEAGDAADMVDLLRYAETITPLRRSASKTVQTVSSWSSASMSANVSRSRSNWSPPRNKRKLPTRPNPIS